MINGLLKTLYTIAVFFIFLPQALAAFTPVIKPPMLQKGDKAAVIASAFYADKESLDVALERLKSIGLNPVYDSRILQRDGYFAGTEKVRIEAINQAIRDDSIKAIFALKGGYGTANLLDKIDYQYLQKHPKIILGRSDLTALLLAVYTRTGLVTFYGPSAAVKQSPATTALVKKLLFHDTKNLVLDNHIFQATEKDNPPVVTLKTITPGVVQGQLIGGNLSVLVSLLGTPYFPKDWQGKILFLEDVNEEIYVMDRMLGQLKNAGVLNQIAGFVFGTCHDCKAVTRNEFSLNEVIDRYIKPLNIPAYRGAMIGHQENMLTVPIGGMVELNADKTWIRLIESPTNSPSPLP